MPRTVAVLVGSLRKESYNRKIANALVEIAPDLTFEFVEIGDLPFYNEDRETATPPATWTRFREQIAASDGVLLVSPEYNRGVPAALKNAIDVGSRPWGKSIWGGKPVAIISSSQGAQGGFGANHHLRPAFVFAGAPVLPHEAYIGFTPSLFDEAGKLTKDDTRKFLADFAAKFAAFIEKNAA